MSTINSNTGVTLKKFDYDQKSHLTSITDQFGNQTTIEYNVSGVPIAIVSPFGLRTTLTIDENNHITHINYPDGNFYSFEYTSDGLMTAETEPNGNRFDHVFDSNGKLTDVNDREGGHWNYTRTIDADGNILVIKETGEGNTTTYLDKTDSTGAYISIITDPTGAQSQFSMSGDGLTGTQTTSCGMEITTSYYLDTIYRYRSAKEKKVNTPSGLQKIVEYSKAYEDTDSDYIYDLTTDYVTMNGRIITFEDNTLISKKTITSPEGRTVTTNYDPDTLAAKSIIIPGFYDTAFLYDANGRVTSVSVGSRTVSYIYNSNGFLTSITNPLTHITNYTYDQVGRIKQIDQPDGNSLLFTYDKNGNMTLLTNPSNIDQTFDYNQVNKESAYHTPLSGDYTYTYDKERILIKTTFPSGKEINNVYENGRVKQIQTPEGNIDFTYLCSSKIDTITKGTEIITYDYDGPLVTSVIQGGILNQTVSYAYNNDFNISSLAYAGGTETYIYDDDGLITGAGTYTVSRNVDNGLPEAVADNALSIARTFNGYGELESQLLIVNIQDVTSWSLARNENGIITQKTETVDSTSNQYAYTYDAMNRLLTVTKDGTLVEEYQYDANGRRTYEMNALRGISGRTFTYSNEDHLITAGTSTAYEYNADGFLTKKTEDTDVTQYEYSSRGELLKVTSPDGIVIEHEHDPLGRRIAKKVNGVITEKYLWEGLTKLLAVYDGSDNLFMRFDYANERMPVSMVINGNKYYLAYDQVGSLKAVTDATGKVIKQIEYDSFGNIITDTNLAFDIPFRFAGGLYDRDTNLIRFGARDYDPEIGIWTAKDPIFFSGRDVNLYCYVQNNPINFVDRNGKCWETAINIISTTIDSQTMGPGELIGSLIGGAIGELLFPIGPVGGLIGGYIGGELGADFDPPQGLSPDLPPPLNNSDLLPLPPPWENLRPLPPSNNQDYHLISPVDPPVLRQR